MSLTAERLKNLGQRVKENVWPNSAKEAEKRSQIAALLGLSGTMSVFFTLIGTRAGREVDPQTEKLIILGSILTVGGLADAITMRLREGQLEENDFARRLTEKAGKFKERVSNLSPTEFKTRLEALRELRSTIKEFDTDPHGEVDLNERISNMVVDIYEERAKSEGLKI